MVYDLSDTYKLYAFDTLNGTQSKWCIPTDNSCDWVKADGDSYAGLSEELCTLLESCIEGIFPYVEYRSCWITTETIRDKGCYSRDFTNGKTEISFCSILEKEYHSLDNYERLFRFSSLDKRFITIVNVIKKYYQINIAEPFARVLLFDAIVLNSDRHLRNLSILCSETGAEMSPCFDNGAALCSDLSRFPLNKKIDTSLIHPRSIGGNFDMQVEVALEYVEPLRLNFNKLFKCLNEYTTEFYSQDVVSRAIQLLFNQLSCNKNRIWIDSSD